MALLQEDVELFERKCAIYVLLAIERYPNSTKAEIMNLDGNANEKTKFLRIRDMIEKGLVKFDYVEGYETKRLNLTPEGQLIANNFKKARINYLRLINKSTNDEE